MPNLDKLFRNAYMNLNIDDDLAIAEIAKNNPYEIAQHYYFAIGESYSSLLNRNIITIAITPKIFFEEEGCLYDNQMLPVEEILKSYASELASSFYDIQQQTTLEEAQEYLLNKGFIQSESFTKLANF